MARGGDVPIADAGANWVNADGSIVYAVLPFIQKYRGLGRSRVHDLVEFARAPGAGQRRLRIHAVRLAAIPPVHPGHERADRVTPHARRAGASNERLVSRALINAEGLVVLK